MAFDQFNRLGHPSQYSYVQKRITGEVILKNGAFGTVSLLIAPGTTGTANLSNGGSIPLQDLQAGVIQEISVESITNITGSLYLFGRDEIEVPIADWILEDGTWNDSNYWLDSEVWKDS